MIWPTVSELVRGGTRVVGPAYYNFFQRAFALPLLLLMGIGPLVAWRRASPRSVGSTFLIPLAAVNLLWLGGLLFVFGSVVAMWPDAREQRRLAQRYVSAAPPPDSPGAAASA